MGAILKIATSKSGTRQLEKYLKQESKTEENLIHGKDCYVDEFAKDFQIVKNINNKTEGRQHYHVIQSFDDDISAEKAHELGKEFLQNEKFKGFQAVCITHKDKEHIHNHIVINSVSFEDGHKFKQSKKDLYELREYSDQILIQNDLEIQKRVQRQGEIRTYDINKYKVFEKHQEGQAKSYLIETAQAVNRSIENTSNREEFIRKMQDEGYNTNWSETRKHITFENIETEKKVRLSNLQKTFNDERFSKENLEKCFEIEKESKEVEDVNIYDNEQLEKEKSMMKYLNEKREDLDKVETKSMLEMLEEKRKEVQTKKEEEKNSKVEEKQENSMLKMLEEKRQQEKEKKQENKQSQNYQDY